MAARENMLSLSAAFTEGTRAEEKVALRKARNHSSLASASNPAYSPLPAAIAAKAIKPSGTPAYAMQPVMSAGDKYRAARNAGEPTPILGTDGRTNAAATAAAASATVSSASSLPVPLFLLLGLGVGTALFVGDYGFADLTTILGVPKAVADASTVTHAATAAAGDAHVHAHLHAGAGVGADAVVGDVSHAPHTHRVQEQQPLWLQRSRRL
jgi:hypothetical protein